MIWQRKLNQNKRVISKDKYQKRDYSWSLQVKYDILKVVWEMKKELSITSWLGLCPRCSTSGTKHQNDSDQSPATRKDAKNRKKKKKQVILPCMIEKKSNIRSNHKQNDISNKYQSDEYRIQEFNKITISC